MDVVSKKGLLGPVDQWACEGKSHSGRCGKGAEGRDLDVLVIRESDFLQDCK